MPNGTYSWDKTSVDDNFLAGFAQDPAYLVTNQVGGQNYSNAYGAQNQTNALEKLQQVNTYMNQKYQQVAAQLKAVNPNINLDAYVDPTYQLWDPGPGSSANVSAPYVEASKKIAAQLDGIKLAQQAVQQYQSTGQLPPGPNYKQKMQDILTSVQNGGGQQYLSAANNARQLISSKLQNIISGTPLDPTGMAEANASAARVGSPLPYPNAGMGNIAGGGAVTNQNVGQAYQNGQMTQTGQQIMNSSAPQQATPGFAPGGVGNQTNGMVANNGQVASSQSNPQVQNLIKQALLGNNLQNLQNQPFWQSADQSVKQQAYSQLTSMMKDPNALAQFVSQNGIQNLKQYDWWNSNPNKDQAWTIIQGMQNNPANNIASNTGTQNSPLGNNGMQNGTQNSTSGTNSSTSGTAASNTNLQSSIQRGMDIIKNSNLSDGEKAYYSQILQNYDGSGGYDPSKVLDAVMKVKNSTIDPYFQEQSGLVADQIKRSVDATNQARGLETQQEGLNANQSIRSAKGSLEANGLTFSGEGVRQLGAQSAYAQPGTPGAAQTAIPTQIPFGGQYLEGNVNTQNRLISSSSQARYQQNLTNLSRQAEQQLGSTGSTGLVGGVQQMGNVTGDIPNQKTQALSSEFNNEASLAANRLQVNAPLNIF